EAEGITAPEDYGRFRSEIRAALKTLRSPFDGEPVFEQILTREEAFNGQYCALMPDLIVVTRDPRLVPLEGKSPGGVFINSATTSGAHAPYGIFIATGEGIHRGVKIENAHLRDIAPTALYAMNEALTEDMDGRALQEIFTSEANAGRSLRREGTSYRTGAQDAAFDEEEQDEIKERMRSLGYIS